MPIIRKAEIENLELMNGDELEVFLQLVPADQETVSRMLDFIEDELYEGECDHHLKHAMIFMMRRQLDFPKLTAWLNNNGGYCDCKVMKEIAPHWRAKFGDD